MRLFVAVELPEPWREAARATRAALERAGAPPLRWVDPALLHLTLRFLGEVPDAALAPLAQALAGDVPPVDVPLAIARPGCFSPRGQAQVVWLGVDGGDDDSLAALAARVERAVVAAGQPPAERPFEAHVTLARVPRETAPGARRALAGAVARLPAPADRGEFRARGRAHALAPRTERLALRGAAALRLTAPRRVPPRAGRRAVDAPCRRGLRSRQEGPRHGWAHPGSVSRHAAADRGVCVSPGDRCDGSW